MRSKVLALGCGVVLTVAACSGGRRDAVPTTTVTTATTPTTAAPPTTPPINPDVVPSVITPAYVNAVFAVLNHAYGDALRTEKETHTVNPSVRADLRAIYLDPQYDVELQIFDGALQGSIAQVRPNPGDRVFRLSALQVARPSCVQVVVRADYSTVNLATTPVETAVVVLEPKESTASQGLNPTPWGIAYEKTTAPAQTCPS